MAREIKLFREPFDLDEVESALQDDKFLSLAFFFTGFEQNWRAALAQMAEIMSLFEGANRNYPPVYRMVATLIERAETFDDTGKFLDEITTALGLLPGTRFMEEIRMSHLHKIDPQAWQKEKNQQWLKNYNANRALFGGGPPLSAPAPTPGKP